MKELELQEIENINGGGVGKDMAWGAIVGGLKGGAEFSEFGPGGIICGGLIGATGGAIGAIGVDGVRKAIGLY